jgi:hypothetical protein
MDGIEMQLKYVIVFMEACTKEVVSRPSLDGEISGLKLNQTSASVQN